MTQFIGIYFAVDIKIIKSIAYLTLSKIDIFTTRYH